MLASAGTDDENLHRTNVVDAIDVPGKERGSGADLERSSPEPRGWGL